MADESKPAWRIPVLTYENHNSWFLQMKIELSGKQVFYTVITSHDEYAKYTGPATSGENCANNLADRFENLTIDNVQYTLNREKSAKYCEASAVAISLMFPSLCEDDQQLYEEHDSPDQFWKHLKLKYEETYESLANTYLHKIHTFSFTEGLTIAEAWDQLKGHRRKLIAADSSMKDSYGDKAMFQILKTALPKEYFPVNIALRSQPNESIERKLQLLREAEHDLAEKDTESGLYARRKGKYAPALRRQQSNLSDNAGEPYTCYLCKADTHLVKSCPMLKQAQHFVAACQQDSMRRERLKGGEYNKKQRESHEKPSLLKARKCDRPTDGKKKRNTVGYMAASDSKVDEPSDIEPEEEDDEDEETAHLSKELIGP